MYVRLAFSVAAHLDPEIMIVDEVLAVGDQAFQAKCLGKMSDVMRQGRTILFVSHSMDAIAALCTTAIHVKKGVVGAKTTVEEGIKSYLNEAAASDALPAAREAAQPGQPARADLPPHRRPHRGSTSVMVPVGSGVNFAVTMKNFADIPGNLTLGIGLNNARGQRVALFHSEYHKKPDLPRRRRDDDHLRRAQPAAGPGELHDRPRSGRRVHIIERVERAAAIEVVFKDVLGTARSPTAGKARSYCRVSSPSPVDL
jgi:ABC-type glutathione transport system ATPase component